MNEETILAWEAYEYEPRKHPADWYWTVGIITIALVVIAVLLGNILLGIVIALSVIILAFYTKKHPRVVDVDITTKGVRHDVHLYVFEHLHSYHIDDRETHLPKLILKSKKMFMPYIIIRLDSVHPNDVEQALTGRVREDTHPEPFFHKLLDRLGF